MYVVRGIPKGAAVEKVKRACVIRYMHILI